MVLTFTRSDNSPSLLIFFTVTLTVAGGMYTTQKVNQHHKNTMYVVIFNYTVVPVDGA